MKCEQVMETVYVKHLGGLYDEEAKPILMEINDRKICLSHKWINASLRWEKRLKNSNFVSINLESPGDKMNRSWGKGYGGIRFCSKCKTIDCIHRFIEEKNYRIGNDRNYDSYVIAKCGICNRRILIIACEVRESQCA